ncbi:MAG: hypothetical protein GY928_36745 [Colwellia sp.]|nr:hypothetical protein [Colwellia sp.]
MENQSQTKECRAAIHILRVIFPKQKQTQNKNKSTKRHAQDSPFNPKKFYKA